MQQSNQCRVHYAGILALRRDPHSLGGSVAGGARRPTCAIPNSMRRLYNTRVGQSDRRRYASWLRTIIRSGAHDMRIWRNTLY